MREDLPGREAYFAGAGGLALWTDARGVGTADRTWTFAMIVSFPFRMANRWRGGISCTIEWLRAKAVDCSLICCVPVSLDKHGRAFQMGYVIALSRNRS